MRGNKRTIAILVAGLALGLPLNVKAQQPDPGEGAYRAEDRQLWPARRLGKLEGDMAGLLRQIHVHSRRHGHDERGGDREIQGGDETTLQPTQRKSA